MAFGISGNYLDEKGQSVEFGAPLADRKKTVASFPDKSVEVIRIYAHGMPGSIGDDDLDALVNMLSSKMKQRGQIHLLGCSTAGVEAPEGFNPVGGWGLFLRMAMYHGIPKWMGNEEAADHWSDNLARDLSRRIPNVYVSGMGGISFAFSRLLGSHEGYKPKIAGDSQIYFNGKHEKSIGPPSPRTGVPAAGKPGQSLGNWR